MYLYLKGYETFEEIKSRHNSDMYSNLEIYPIWDNAFKIVR